MSAKQASSKIKIVRLAIPRYAEANEFHALIRSLDGDIDVMVPLVDVVLDHLAGRAAALFGAEINDRTGAINILGEVSLLRPRSKENNGRQFLVSEYSFEIPGQKN